MIDGVGKSIIVLFLLFWDVIIIWIAYRRDHRYSTAHHERYEYYRKMRELRKDVLILGYDVDPSRTWGWVLAALGQVVVSSFCCIEIAIISNTFGILAWAVLAVLFVPFLLLMFTSGDSITIFTDDGIERSRTSKKYEPTKVKWTSVESVLYRNTGAPHYVETIVVRYDRGSMEFSFGNEEIDILKEIMKHVPSNIIEPKLLDRYHKSP